MLLCRSRLHQLLHSPQGQPIPVPARREIVEYPPLPMLVAVLLQHPQHRIAPQTAKAGDPHGDAAVQQALGQDIPLGRNGFLTVQPGRRTIQQQIHAESGPRFLVLPQKHPVVPQHRLPPYPGAIEPSLPGRHGVRLLVDQHAVADLLRQPQQGAFIQLAVLGVGRPVQPGLLRRLLIQLLAVAAGRHIRRRVPPGKPQPAPQVVPGAPLLLDGAQLLWGIYAPPEAPLDIRPVRLRPLVGAQHGPQRVRRPDKPRLSGMGRPADSQIVGAHQLCWRYLGHKCDPPPVVEVQPQLRLGPHPSVKAQILPEARPNVLLQLLRADVPAAQCPVQSLVPGRHQPCGFPQHAFPPGRLHGVYQLIPRHPLLPGGLVFHGEELPGMGLPQLLQCGPLGQLLFIRRIFQGQPRQIVHHRLPHIPQP